MIVLDLFADVKPIWKQSSQFYGVPYVWYVHPLVYMCVYFIYKSFEIPAGPSSDLFVIQYAMVFSINPIQSGVNNETQLNLTKLSVNNLHFI